jgi:hypothetical protein
VKSDSDIDLEKLRPFITKIVKEALRNIYGRNGSGADAKRRSLKEPASKGRRSRGRLLPPAPPDGLATIRQAAFFLQVSERQIYRLVDARKIEKIEIGQGTRGTRITWDSLHRFVAGQLDEVQPN